ncbi:NAD(P)H-dependent glycerol-3-phosphate dehydrogenase [Mycoplasma simbae]|uniref:NAD(P)H-dependent glycerol-3-phosphate dehydrogenase n=1 Tax=Mycoplasma simbae TaxID=36744 RepID=UPI0004950EC7|nr:NAD(P)H-dependent glycerol-3-phosphate dehydrogenase [Mycoplasma simbae]
MQLKIKKIAFIGTGAWASALASMLTKNGVEVKMWGIDEQEINDINNGINSKYFGEEKFNNPHLIKATSNLAYALRGVNTIVIAVPTPAIVDVLGQIKEVIGKKLVNVINVAKGIEPKSKKFFTEVIRKKLAPNVVDVCSLIGPSFADEVFYNHKTMINVVGKNPVFLKRIQDLFCNDSFVLIPNEDENGAQAYAALKNVLAIGIGIASGLHSAKNLAPALISLGMKEIMSIAKVVFPPVDNTVGYELAAIGDIVLTCLNTSSRNYSFGLQVAQIGVKKALAANTKTVEGYNTAKTLDRFIWDLGWLDIPFFRTILEILLYKMDPKKILWFFRI